MEARNLLVKEQHLTNHSTRKGGITMKKFLTLVSALVVLALFTGLGGAEQKPATQESEQNMCSQTKMRLLDQVRTAEACAENANKKRRASDAKNCWNAFPSKTDAMSERAQAEVIPDRVSAHRSRGRQHRTQNIMLSFGLSGVVLRRREVL